MAGITDAQLISDKRRLKRLVISTEDLNHAKRYAELILNRDSADGKYLISALKTALIVAYWRPFSGNEKKKKPDTLPKLETSTKRILRSERRSYTIGLAISEMRSWLTQARTLIAFVCW
jgi:hypothetical protein